MLKLKIDENLWSPESSVLSQSQDLIKRNGKFIPNVENIGIQKLNIQK
jgi:hypothetical protein